MLVVAESGFGVAQLDAPLADEAIASGQLVRVSQAWLTNPASHYLVMRSGESRGMVLEAAAKLLALSAPLRR